MIRCPESSTIYNTREWAGDQMPNNDTVSDKMLSTQVRLARETRERANPGAITYVVGTVAYRASIGPDNKIVKKPIFAFPSTASVAEFQDMIVHDDFAIIELPNTDAFQAFIRPKPEGLNNAIAASRILSISNSQENSMIFRAEYEPNDTRLFLYVI